MRYVWFVIFISFTLLAYGQNSAKVKQLEKQRKQALEEIEMTNKLLQETEKSSRSSLNRLNLLSQQILSRKKVISLLNQEITALDQQIVDARKEIQILQQELEGQRAKYSKAVQGLSKRRTSQDRLLFILSADNFAQSLRRMRYLREYAEWQKRQANEIVDKQKEITQKQRELENTRSEKNTLLGEREQENKKLQGEEQNQKKEVAELNKKRKNLQAELQKKRKQADALNKQSEKQIAEEIARAEAEAKAARERERLAREKAAAAGSSAPAPVREERVADSKGGYAMTKEEKKLSDDFGNNRGKLPFPVAGRYTIVSRFGEQQHQELKYVRTNNNGIDIQTTPGTDARAVFNGEVTRVFVVPGYNNSVIVRHGNYLTVYSNLSQVYVKAGDKVSTRQPIGKIFTDTEDGNATILHFQLWKEKVKQNPLPWLD
ncbi:MAG: peptidoglycan DD-metalloendopeptidase family protein [Tannerellaceae bacterium]|nr:peptidoglycan DD-metalloendopeptidase family protein [Tannerellaceae bacterium]